MDNIQNHPVVKFFNWMNHPVEGVDLSAIERKRGVDFWMIGGWISG
jgi:hypothetical protein